jgi:hypothetical protein
MVATFAVVFSWLYLHTRADGPTLAARPAPLEPAQLASPAAPTLPVRAMPQAAESSVWSPEKAHAPPQEAPARAPLPVRLQFVQRTLPPDAGSPGQPKLVLLGRLMNQSLQSLTIEVGVTSGTDQSVATSTLTVDGHHIQAFGPDDGLAMHAGDQVMLKSYPYADLTVRVPNL